MEYIYFLASLDMKKKLYGSVLVVGGGLSFPGAPLMLQQRLYSKLPPMFQRSSDAIEVCSNPKVSSEVFTIKLLDHVFCHAHV